MWEEMGEMKQCLERHHAINHVLADRVAASEKGHEQMRLELDEVKEEMDENYELVSDRDIELRGQLWAVKDAQVEEMGEVKQGLENHKAWIEKVTYRVAASENRHEQMRQEQTRWKREQMQQRESRLEERTGKLERFAQANEAYVANMLEHRIVPLVQQQERFEGKLQRVTQKIRQREVSEQNGMKEKLEGLRNRCPPEVWEELKEEEQRLEQMRRENEEEGPDDGQIADGQMIMVRWPDGTVGEGQVRSVARRWMDGR